MSYVSLVLRQSGVTGSHEGTRVVAINDLKSD